MILNLLTALQEKEIVPQKAFKSLLAEPVVEGIKNFMVFVVDSYQNEICSDMLCFMVKSIKAN